MMFGDPPIQHSEVRTTSSTGGQKGVKLQRFDLIPIGPLTKLAEHYGRGALKYDEHQWRQGFEWSKSYSAIMRHLTAWWDGEDYDKCPKDRSGCAQMPAHMDIALVELREDVFEICYNHTGSHHLDGVMWHAFALREFVETYPQHDDRHESTVSDS
jgi:hypothetical protein